MLLHDHLLRSKPSAFDCATLEGSAGPARIYPINKWFI